MKAEWAKGEKIAELLDVTTAACTICRGPARVPEDVVAVVEQDGRKVALVVCESCQPAFMAELNETIGPKLEGLLGPPKGGDGDAG